MAIPVQIVGEGVDWPAWVQAVGSLVAIMIAIAIPLVASSFRRRQFRKTVLVYGRMMHDAVEAAAIRAGVAPVVRSTSTLQLVEIELNLQVILDAARALSMERLESALGANAFVRLIGATTSFVNEMDGVRSKSPIEQLVDGKTPLLVAYERVATRFSDLQHALK